LKRVRCLTMSAPMIRAYQAGLKWQTRRVVRPDLWPIFEESARTNAGRASHQMLDFDVPCPYGEAGDELLLREPHKIEEVYPCGPHRMVRVRYLADDSVWDRELTMNEHAKLQARKYPLRAQPGRFMYRSLCRYRARLTRVRVERVQDIGCYDIRQEGVPCPVHTKGQCVDSCPSLLQAWEILWDSINARRGFGWATNPWVWVLHFEPMEEE